MIPILLDLKKDLETELQKNYRSVKIRDLLYFIGPNDEYIHVDIFEDMQAIVLEYADTLEDAENFVFEDGDPRSIRLRSKEQIIEECLQEIINN